MCFFCDGGTIEEWLDHTHALIRDYGFMTTSVVGGKPEWTYTIGLIESFDHPELVVTGIDADDAHALIHQVVAHIKSGERFEVGDTELHGVPLRIGAVHPTQWQQGRFNAWLDYYGEAGEPRLEPAAVQILWSSDRRALLSAPVAHDVNRPIGRARGRRKRKGRR